MKIMNVGDPHCHYDDGRIENGRPARFADWLKSADAIVEIAARIRPDLITVPGDYFVTPRPPMRAVLAVADFLGRLQKIAPVVGTIGNHDIGAPGEPTPVHVLRAMGIPNWGVDMPQVVRVWVEEPNPFKDTGAYQYQVQVAVLPFVKAGAQTVGANDVAEKVGLTSAALVDIVRMLAAQIDPALPSILIGHWGVSGCRTANEQIMLGQEPTIPLSALQEGPWQAVIMGHIHTPQEFPKVEGGPVVIHTGAMERRDYGEEEDERVLSLIDTEARTVEWIPYWTRRYWTWRLGKTDVQILANGAPIAAILAPADDAICRVTYHATEEQQRSMDQDAIRRALLNAGAIHFSGIYPTIERSDRIRVAGLTEKTQPIDALAEWLTTQTDMSDDLKGLVAASGNELIQEALQRRAVTS